MSDREAKHRTAREAVEAMAGGRALPYAALLVSSVVLGFELFRG
ncbi:MAG: hypothetical protein U1F58_15815 [Burkholderiales bacterium]